MFSVFFLYFCTFTVFFIGGWIPLFVVGHRKAGCAGVCCHFCGQGSHEPKNCASPKVCHGCGGPNHLYQSCPSRRKTFAQVAKLPGGFTVNKEPGKGGNSAGTTAEEKGERSNVGQGRDVQAPP